MKILPIDGSWVKGYLIAYDNGDFGETHGNVENPTELLHGIVSELNGRFPKSPTPLIIVRIPQHVWKGKSYEQIHRLQDMFINGLSDGTRLVMAVPCKSEDFEFIQFNVEDVETIDFEKLRDDVWGRFEGFIKGEDNGNIQ